MSVATTREAVDAVKAEFSEKVMSLGSVQQVYDYLPEEIAPNSVVFFFQAPTVAQRSTTAMVRNSLEFSVGIYVHGDTSKAQQQRMEEITLDLFDMVEDMTKIGGCKLPELTVELRQRRFQYKDREALVKNLRLVCETTRAGGM